jgi:hypothetical protein
MSSRAQRAANRANARHSTGPKTEEGKSRSAENSLRHGLASGRLIIPGECRDEYDRLEADLLKRHRPANVTETLLVQEMAQSYWLKERAVRLQSKAFHESDGIPKDLAILMRYQTDNLRAFHKALTALTNLQKERRKEEIGFVSLKAELKAEIARLKQPKTASPDPFPLPDPPVATPSSRSPLIDPPATGGSIEKCS